VSDLLLSQMGNEKKLMNLSYWFTELWKYR